MVQRKYLDRGRSIPLEGRPFRIDWMLLLGAGLSAAHKGRTEQAPFLEQVMWAGVDPKVIHPRPAALDFPLMRSWLDVNEREAMAYLIGEWGPSLLDPPPHTAEQVRALLDRGDCVAAGRGAHLMARWMEKVEEGTASWYVGYCAHCVRALLLRVDAESFEVSWWPFYDQEAPWSGAAR
jgi:hypothetical protein